MHPDDSLATQPSQLRRMVEGDEESWREFDRRYRPVIVGYLVNRGLAEADARDVTQEVMTELWQKLPEFDRTPGRGSFRSWLFQRVTWRLGDRLRRQKRHAGEPLRRDDAHTGTAERIPAEPLSAEAEFDLAWAREIEEEALDRLARNIPAIQFQAFALSHRNQLPAARIAELLGANRATVYVWVHRVRKLYETELTTVRARRQ